MKTILKGHDDLIYRLQLEDNSGTEVVISDFDSFKVEIFTDNINTAVNVSQYIDKENLLRVPAQSLTTLSDGIVRMKVSVSMTDSEFPDQTFDQSRITDTCYFLKTYNA
jgi:hypothetical protein